jgi:hypothetical protein
MRGVVVSNEYAVGCVVGHRVRFAVGTFSAWARLLRKISGPPADDELDEVVEVINRAAPQPKDDLIFTGSRPWPT